MASLTGTWFAPLAGFGGFRVHGDMSSFEPALPEGLTRLRFSIRWQEVRMTVEIHRDEVPYAVGADD